MKLGEFWEKKPGADIFDEVSELLDSGYITNINGDWITLEPLSSIRLWLTELASKRPLIHIKENKLKKYYLKTKEQVTIIISVVDIEGHLLAMDAYREMVYHSVRGIDVNPTSS